MSRKSNRFTRDFGTAVRDVDETFEPNELQNPTPWPLIAIAVLLALWGAVTLYLDAKANRAGEASQRSRQSVEDGTADARTTPLEVANAEGDRSAAQGAALFGTYCATCHQSNGSGVRGAIPPLSGSRYVLANADVPTAIVLRGIVGPLDVNDVNYSGRMPTFHAVLSDKEVAQILTHVRSAWSNGAEPVHPEQVAAVRSRFQRELDQPWAGGAGLHATFDIPPIAADDLLGTTSTAAQGDGHSGDPK
ncbi:cytochrome c [Lysobacter sp. A03]|uniref:c-type cytochrome n=1 Tax=Lysobacter sp. A03 TaxID=1199154 RepID=UPI0005B6D36E|nr:cytochrome c [Lysobacter sp. A03]KIQ97235.1 Copper-containing nitrite reductase [Lysobacter sp. A03]